MTVTDLASRRGPQNPVRTAWVLGGGGNLGSIQIGMLRAVVERGEVPDLIVGCSVGSLNGLAMAADPSIEGVERLRRIWLELDADHVFPSSRVSGPWMLLKKAKSLYPADGLRDLVERCAPHPNIEDYPIPYECVATNLHTGRARWFDRGEVVRPILASAALPAAFPPVEIDGDEYIDGAVVDNVPISRALFHGVDRITVFHVGNFERPRPQPKRPIDVLLQSFSIARNFRFDSDLARVPEGIDVTVLPGIDPGPMKRNDFSRTSELIERAHAAAAAYLDLRDKHQTG